MTSPNTVLVTGGAGFIGSNFVLDWIAATGESVVNLDALTYAGNRENLASLDGDPRHRFVQGDILDRPLLDELLRPAPAARRDPLRRREPRRPQHPRPGGVREDQRRRHLHPARGGAPALGRAGRGGAQRLPLPPRLDRRGLRLAPARRAGLHRDPSACAEQPVLGEQGGERPPGAGLAPHLRPAGAHHQLQQQLRALSLPREADPADDRQRPRRQAAAGLRRRHAGARLALRQGPLRRDPRGAGARPGRRDLQHRRLEREAQRRDRRDRLRPARRDAARSRRARTAAWSST